MIREVENMDFRKTFPLSLWFGDKGYVDHDVTSMSATHQQDLELNEDSLMEKSQTKVENQIDMYLKTS